ncbi:MAG TPA: nuclear transport factor 2 family protein [Pyrinomonadaceae bacterium]|nr:nuclear transport factor 2 family protein [Pyrinomonadaceae bacterium]
MHYPIRFFVVKIPTVIAWPLLITKPKRKGPMLSNLNTVKAIYQAFAEADIPSVLGFLSRDIAWTEAEGFPYAGTYHGPNSVLTDVFMRLATEWNGFAAVPEEFIDGGETVVALGKYSGTYKATGKSFQANFAHVWKLQDGKAIRFVQYVDTLLVHRALQA